jgi:hypothetical protein
MLTIRFIPYYDIKHLSSSQRIRKILDIVKEEYIVLLEGKLKKEEETQLIKVTMEQISDQFKGIEIAQINPGDNETNDFFAKMREQFLNLMLGDRQGFTIIGPASIVKEIKQDPNKIELLTKDKKKR